MNRHVQKFSIGAIFSLTLSIGCQSPHTLPSPNLPDGLSIYDNTASWTLPYKLPSEEYSTRISAISAVGALPKASSITAYNQLLGKPDVIEDLRGPFNSTSARETMLMVDNRRYISYKAKWYLQMGTPNSYGSNDIWFSAYIGADGHSVLFVIKENFKKLDPAIKQPNP